MATTTLVITDTHIGKEFKDDRIPNTLNVFADMVEDIKPDVLIHLGDVFNVKKPGGQHIEFATQWFRRLSESAGTIFVIAGGHDQDAHSETTAIDFLDDLARNIEIFTEMHSIEGICFLPYTRRLQKADRLAMENAEIILMHQGIVESPLDHGKRLYGKMGDAVPLAWVEHSQLTLCGHIHTPWSNPQNNVIILGSPYPTHFRHPDCQRSAGLFSLEDPSDFTLVDFPGTFKLQRQVIEVREKENLQAALMKKLVSPEPDVYYYVVVAIEGNHKPAVIKEARTIVESVYGEQVDDIQVSLVLPKNIRTNYEKLRVTANKAMGKSPVEMLDIWTQLKADAYYKSNPTLKERMLQEFDSIIATVEATETLVK